MALVAAALWTSAPALGHLALFLTDPGDPRWAQFNTVDIIATSCVGISLALYVYLRTGRRDAAFVMDLALVYMVVMAFGIGVLIHWGEPSFVPTDVRPDDHLGRADHSHHRGDRARQSLEDAGRRIHRRLHGLPRDDRRKGRRTVRLRARSATCCSCTIPTT